MTTTAPDQRKRVLWLLGVGLAGLLVGLIIAWVLAPVQWTDTDPIDLRQEHKSDYVVMLADSFAITNDVGQAQKRLLALSDGSNLVEVGAWVESVAAERAAAGDQASAVRIRRMTKQTGLADLAGPAADLAPAVVSGRSIPRWLIILLAVGLFLVSLAVVAALLLARSKERRKKETEDQFPIFDSGLAPILESGQSDAQPTSSHTEAITDPFEALMQGSPQAADEPQPAAIPSAPQDLTLEADAAATAAAPAQTRFIKEFDVEYQYGDDDFYSSFTIDTPQESFVGQCGMVISDVLGAEDAQLVDAFDLWLFETEGTRTVTQVLMSPYAFGQEGIVAKLSRKGDVLEIKPGLETELVTDTLLLKARVSDYRLVEHDTYPEGVFESLRVHLTVERTS